MYKLLIVDDEEIEREGMANFIPWEDYDIRLVGTAGNGVEGFELVQQLRPDILLTDVKMPLMNGIELVHKVRQSFPQIECVILSGYGDYAYTSQAMEEGLRHYILKPCNEEKIMAVLAKVKQSLCEKQQQRAYAHTVNRLIPRAKEQIFRNMLLGKEQVRADYEQLLGELGEAQRDCFVLAIRSEKGFDYMNQFVIGNMMNDLLPPNSLLMNAAIQKDVLLLVAGYAQPDTPQAVARLRVEYRRFSEAPLTVAAGERGDFGSAHTMYTTVQTLLSLAGAQPQAGDKILTADSLPENAANSLVEWERLQAAQGYEQCIFELYLLRLKMEVCGLPQGRQLQMLESIRQVLCPAAPPLGPAVQGELWEPLFALAQSIAARHGNPVESKETARYHQALNACYRSMGEAQASLRYLANEVLYMNEDYLGRLFTRHAGERFSLWLEKTRIELAKRLMEFAPALKVSELAQWVGYAPDGQYFSKVFRKVTGQTPSEYREQYL